MDRTYADMNCKSLLVRQRRRCLLIAWTLATFVDRKGEQRRRFRSKRRVVSDFAPRRSLGRTDTAVLSLGREIGVGAARQLCQIPLIKNH